MLSELHIRDFAIIEALDLEFAPGFNVLTGETGAGKSIILDCISLLIGDRAEPTMVRAGAQAALVEGVFALNDALRPSVEAALAEFEIELDDPDHLVLGREVRINGRSIARVNGRAVNQAALRALGELLIDLHGQGEHLSLLRVREHINLLDRFAGRWDLRQQVAEAFHALRNTRRELEMLRSAERERERRLDMLRFQLEEIRSARLKPGEEAELQEEHARLANAEALAAWADEAYSALYESRRDAPSAIDQVAQALRALANLERFDKQFAEHHRALEEASVVMDEIARTLRDYRDRIEFNPRRLQQVEDRLELLKKLKRKYGESVEAVIAYGERIAEELAQIETAGERIEWLEQVAAEQEARLRALAEALSAVRREAAAQLARGIEAELNDLRMSGARFQVAIEAQPPDATGCDRVEFLIAPNPGEGLKPLAKIASGGETARLMLALKTTLAHADPTPTLIFDEIDQGIGGRVGVTVGEKLWRLARNHQVLCITHLPQMAAFGDAHFKVEKRVRDGRTSTHVRRLGRAERLEELAQMLGASGEAGLRSAEQLLQDAAALQQAAQGRLVAGVKATAHT
ncbi:MAG: DNA repair protein RecN [Anaerolineae bacterium]|nr:DNA repair protein RecN [Anaerolineae bacterium]